MPLETWTKQNYFTCKNATVVGNEIPVRIRKRIPAIQVGQPGIRAIPEIAAVHESCLFQYSVFNFGKMTFFQPDGRSPLDSPTGAQSAATKSQDAFESENQQCKEDSPANEPTPREPHLKYSRNPLVLVPPAYI